METDYKVYKLDWPTCNKSKRPSREFLISLPTRRKERMWCRNNAQGRGLEIVHPDGVKEKYGTYFPWEELA